ncbi:hypothetical protein B0H63DRAFT_521354 [Podospora didyma]|uniref:Uncharacterized protein n=1 Tax=Podospora didyma TaxID=330526 RepID=A0AAE0U1M9_9PEZI|nr:hypothetical protein B0H63DRAFT_521354 [Podospora didyma]
MTASFSVASETVYPEVHNGTPTDIVIPLPVPNRSSLPRRSLEAVGSKSTNTFGNASDSDDNDVKLPNLEASIRALQAVPPPADLYERSWAIEEKLLGIRRTLHTLSIAVLENAKANAGSEEGILPIPPLSARAEQHRRGREGIADDLVGGHDIQAGNESTARHSAPSCTPTLMTSSGKSQTRRLVVAFWQTVLCPLENASVEKSTVGNGPVPGTLETEALEEMGIDGEEYVEDDATRTTKNMKNMKTTTKMTKSIKTQCLAPE